MSLIAILVIIIIHFLGEFVLQSQVMVVNKSESLPWLFVHCLTYSILFLPFGVAFVFVTFCLHMLVDYFTSKAYMSMIRQIKPREQTLVFGADQALHMLCLVSTYYLLK